MNKSLLIADSGGSGTDWCYVNSKGEKFYFKGASYHPRNFTTERMLLESDFWSNHSEMKNAEVFFYGAGCGAEFEQNKMIARFHSWGFQKVHVSSDLLGACKALFNTNKGNLVILGTGSVLAKYNNGIIEELKGGLGSVLGDEGSGYTFGKLVLKTYLEGSFNKETAGLLSEILGDKATILKQTYSTEGHTYISQLAKQVAHLNELAEIKAIHYQNIKTFIDQFIMNEEVKADEKYIFVGSYAFFNQDTIRELMTELNLKVELFIQNPIEKLADYSINQTL
jgi:glucosamine kinase